MNSLPKISIDARALNDWGFGQRGPKFRNKATPTYLVLKQKGEDFILTATTSYEKSLSVRAIFERLENNGNTLCTKCVLNTTLSGETRTALANRLFPLAQEGEGNSDLLERIADLFDVTITPNLFRDNLVLKLSYTRLEFFQALHKKEVCVDFLLTLKWAKEKKFMTFLVDYVLNKLQMHKDEIVAYEIARKAKEEGVRISGLSGKRIAEMAAQVNFTRFKDDHYSSIFFLQKNIFSLHWFLKENNLFPEQQELLLALQQNDPLFSLKYLELDASIPRTLV